MIKLMIKNNTKKKLKLTIWISCQPTNEYEQINSKQTTTNEKLHVQIIWLGYYRIRNGILADVWLLFICV